MKKAKKSYETPKLTEADFGAFVQGDSRNAPGQAQPNDQGSDDIP